MNLHWEILYSNLCLSWLGVSLCSAYGYFIFTEFGGGFFLLSALLFWVFFFLHRTLYTFVNVRGTVSKHGVFFGDGDSHVSSLSDYQMPVPLGRREVHRIAKRDARQ